MCRTCCHVDEDALARTNVAHLKQHHVGGQVVDGESGALLEAHRLGHEEGAVSGRHDHFLPHAAAVQHDDPIPHLREEEDREGGTISDAGVAHELDTEPLQQPPSSLSRCNKSFLLLPSLSYRSSWIVSCTCSLFSAFLCLSNSITSSQLRLVHHCSTALHPH